MKGRGTNNKTKKSANLVISNNFSLLDQDEEDVNQMVEVARGSGSSSKKAGNIPPSSKKLQKRGNQQQFESTVIPAIENISSNVEKEDETLHSDVLNSSNRNETIIQNLVSNETIDESVYKPLTLKKLYIHQNTWKGII